MCWFKKKRGNKVDALKLHFGAFSKSVFTLKYAS